jgi:hypothetical protein
VSQEKLRRHLLPGTNGFAGTTGHHQLTHLELPRSLELLHEALKTGFKDGYSLRAGITLPHFTGLLEGDQEILIAQLAPFLFGCQHRKVACTK